MTVSELLTFGGNPYAKLMLHQAFSVSRLFLASILPVQTASILAILCVMLQLLLMEFHWIGALLAGVTTSRVLGSNWTQSKL